MSQQQNHLLGHVLACAVRAHCPELEVPQSQNDTQRFWLELPDTLTISLSDLQQTMASIVQNFRVFEHRDLPLQEVNRLFPGQPVKLQESRSLVTNRGLVPAYCLDQWVDFCSCQHKRPSDLERLRTQEWALESFSWGEHGYRIEGGLVLP